jgi:transcription factor SPN1
MFIDTNALKESGLGKIVLFYTKKNKRVSPAIKNQADNLVAAWSRPILKRSASYRDRTLAIADVDSNTTRKAVKLSQILAQGRAEEAGRIRRNAVRIPGREMAAFNVVPRSNVGMSGSGSQQAHFDIERRRAAEVRLRRVQRRVDLNKKHASRM